MDVVKKVFFIVPSMRGGGSERVISIIVNNLDRKKFLPILILVKKEGEYLRNIKDDIEIVDLNSSRTRYAIPKIIKLILLRKPDIVFSTLGHLNLLIALIKPMFPRRIKFIARESSIVSINNHYSNYEMVMNLLYKKIYNNFDLIIAQSNYMKDDLVSNYKVIPNKIKIINNPVNINNIRNITKEKLDIEFNKKIINLIAVGSLNKVKGFDLLIKAMSELNDNYFLTILGEGKERSNLENLIDELNLNNRVNLLGFKSNPYKYMNSADLFILSSRYEGFPNVVLEANSCGLPVVAFKCSGGTREIIKNGKNGLLVECGNIDKLVEQIIFASKYSFNKKEIKNMIQTKYSLEKIIKKYEEVLISEF